MNNMDVSEYFDAVQEYVKANIQNPEELDSIIKEMEKDNLQAVINQDYNNVNGDYEKAIAESGEKILKSANIKGGVDMNEPVKLDGDRALNTMERKVLNFTDFLNENKDEKKKKKENLAISHMWYDMYGVFGPSGDKSPLFKGTFDECQQYINGEEVTSTANYNIKL